MTGRSFAAYCSASQPFYDLIHSIKHLALSPNQPHLKITGNDYYEGCKAWEVRKNGCNFIILREEEPIGSISYSKINNITADCGYWIKSSLWGKGFGKETFSMFLPMIKNAGFQYVTASILKENEASLKIWMKYTADIKEEEYRYITMINLEHSYIS